MGENEKTHMIDRELDEAENRMRQKYECSTKHPLVHVAEKTRWEAILPNGSLIDFKGKSILDLGCGSKKGGDQYPPWFCRAAKELGAKRVVGIDIAPNDHEEFEHHQMDLTDPKNLSIFDNESFDYVNSSRFIFPPEMGASTSPVLLGMTTPGQLRVLPAMLQKQVERFLKNEGLYMTDDGTVFVKKDGTLSCEGNWLEISMRKEGRSKEEIARTQKILAGQIEVTPEILELLEKVRLAVRKEMRAVE